MFKFAGIAAFKMESFLSAYGGNERHENVSSVWEMIEYYYSVELKKSSKKVQNRVKTKTQDDKPTTDFV